MVIKEQQHVFDKTTRDELINRINSLNENSTSNGQNEGISNAETLYAMG